MKKIVLLALMISLHSLPLSSMENVVPVLSRSALNILEYKALRQSTFVLCSQTFVSYWLKKNDYMFNKELPHDLDLHPYLPFLFDTKFLPLLSASAAFLTTFPMYTNEMIYSTDVRQGYIAVSTLLHALIHVLNLSYSDSLEDLRKIPLSIQSKIAFTPEFLSQQICLICHDTPDSEAISLCDYEEHMYCRRCLTNWFNTVQRIKSQDEQKFACLQCMKEIKPDNEKVEITRPGNKVSKKGFLWSLVGINGICILGLAFNLYTIVAHW